MALTGRRKGVVNDRKGKGKMIATPPAPLSPSEEQSERRAFEFLSVELVLHFVRNVLDVLSNLGDNIYLFSRLRLLPLSEHRTTQADRFTDYAALLSSAIGLMLVRNARLDVWAEGRVVRKGVLKLEERIEKLVVMEVEVEVTKEEGEAAGSSSAVVAEEDRKLRGLEGEERWLKDRVRTERRKLKQLRDELTDLWWERLRLGAEGVFAVYDVLELETGSEAIRSWSGLTSAAILFSQTWQEYYSRG
ncbi:hypothetical protein T439DRAFT_323690 [Meredithblackwellia eburnea MCA 4105]